ncbi:induced myeloid leukemia cell differentiation protein Mcl-1-like [Solea senegalensis]|nr:induced myeloid leukemia cell differentiation protein Mcl-1b [Solea senegalensis]KAG7476203.1 induced myeloid leukemia cell differentiation protein Mcl-1-like [Solea senegalensis]
MNIIPATKRTALKVTTGVMGYLILPQNGGAERAMDYQGNASSHVAVTSSMDNHHGNVGSSVDNAKRPKNLQVNTANGFAAKARLEDSNVDGGSLPCTPEMQSDTELHVPSCTASDHVLDTDTRQLITQFLRDFILMSPPRWKESKALTTMKRVVDGVLEKHRYAYNGMINKLSLDNVGDDVSFVSSVAKSLFGDGTTNWGRITSLVAFGAVVCQHLKERGQQNAAELVGQEISSYLLCHQRDWLLKNNSWDGFVDFFRVEDPESTLRNALLGICGVAGIGATLAFLTR